MALLLVVTLLGLWLLWGELIPVGDGLGFGDGRTYGRLAMNFPRSILAGAIDTYRMARIIPSLAVYLVLQVSSLPANPQVTVMLFRLMNVALLVISCYLWVAVGRRWGITRLAGWIGFIGLFVNFQNLKMSLYYPTLTDTAAFAGGMLLLFAFVRRDVWLTAGVAGLAAFTSPPLLAGALTLLVIPKLERSSSLRTDGPYRFASLALALALGGGVGYWLVGINARFGGYLVSGGENVWQPVYLVSVALVIAYLVAASRPLWASLLSLRWSELGRWLGSSSDVLLLIGRVLLAAFIVVAAFAMYQVGSAVTARNTDVLLERMVYESVARPLMFLVGHVMSFGPIVLVAAMTWRGVARRVHDFGPGLVLMFLGIVFLGLTSESRTITFVLPFVAAFAVLATGGLEWSPKRVVAFGVLSLVVSRAWFPINWGSLVDGPYLEFPAQFYFMNFAPWMSNSVYVGAIFVLMAVTAAVYWIVPREADVA